MIDENGIPYYPTQISGRNSPIIKEPIEKHGWVKTLTFREIQEKDVWRPIENTMDFERKRVLIVREYFVNVERKRCPRCEENDESFDYLRQVPSLGLVRRCFKNDITVSFLGSNSARAFKFVSEKIVTPKQAYDMITSGFAYCGDLSLRKQVGIIGI